LLIRCLFFFCS